MIGYRFNGLEAMIFRDDSGQIYASMILDGDEGKILKVTKDESNDLRVMLRDKRYLDYVEYFK